MSPNYPLVVFLLLHNIGCPSQEGCKGRCRHVGDAPWLTVVQLSCIYRYGDPVLHFSTQVTWVLHGIVRWTICFSAVSVRCTTVRTDIFRRMRINFISRQGCECVLIAFHRSVHCMRRCVSPRTFARARTVVGEAVVLIGVLHKRAAVFFCFEHVLAAETTKGRERGRREKATAVVISASLGTVCSLPVFQVFVQFPTVVSTRLRRWFPRLQGACMAHMARFEPLPRN